MKTVVFGCFGCGGEELPELTCTIMYREEDGSPKAHWICRECMERFGDRIIELTHEDMHPMAQEEFHGFSPYREVEEVRRGTPAAA